MSTEKLEHTNSTKYLGFTFSSDKKDDIDMLRQLRILYTKSNRILRLFNCCSINVKLALFRSYYYHLISIILLLMIVYNYVLWLLPEIK